MKRPHWEREELLQVFLLGAIAARPKLLDSLETTDFTGAWSECVGHMKRAVNGKDCRELNQWLDLNLGAKRENGDTTIDAALERFRQDAAFRRASKLDQYEARMARLIAEMRDKRLRKE